MSIKYVNICIYIDSQMLAVAQLPAEHAGDAKDIIKATLLHHLGTVVDEAPDSFTLDTGAIVTWIVSKPLQDGFVEQVAKFEEAMAAHPTAIQTVGEC